MRSSLGVVELFLSTVGLRLVLDEGDKRHHLKGVNSIDIRAVLDMLKTCQALRITSGIARERRTTSDRQVLCWNQEYGRASCKSAGYCQVRNSAL